MMNPLCYIATLIFIFVVTACDGNTTTSQNPYKDKPYSIYFQDRNLCVTLPYPRVMLSGEEYWDVDMSEIYNELYKILCKDNLSGYYDIYARFEVPQTDKYGNQTMGYNDKFIATIDAEDVRKFVDSNYFNNAYNIESSFRKAAGLNEHKLIYADPPTEKHGKLYEFIFGK